MKPLADQCCGAAATVGGQDYLHTLSENRGKEKQSDGTTILTSHMKLMYTNFPSTLEDSNPHILIFNKNFGVRVLSKVVRAKNKQTHLNYHFKYYILSM